MRRSTFFGLSLGSIVAGLCAPAMGAAVISDGFTEYGTTAPNNTTTIAGRTPDTADVPATTYTTGGNNGGVGPLLVTTVGNPSPAAQTNGNGYVAINLNNAAGSLITISADLQLGTLTEGSGNLYRGDALGFYSTPPTGGGALNESNLKFTGLVVNPGNATDGVAAGTLRLITNGTASATVTAAPFSGFSATTFYNLSYTVNTTTGAITNVTFNGNNDTASFPSTSVTGFTAAATQYAAFYGSTDTNINFTGYVDNFTVAPEPASLGLLGLGALGLLARRRTA